MVVMVRALVLVSLPASAAFEARCNTYRKHCADWTQNFHLIFFPAPFLARQDRLGAWVCALSAGRARPCEPVDECRVGGRAGATKKTAKNRPGSVTPTS